MAKSKSLLDLSTTGEVKRKHLTIDGTPYEIRDKDELTLDQQQQFTHFSKYFPKYLEEEADVSEHTKAKMLLNNCLNLICVDLPAKIRGKLTDNQKYDIFKAFGEANSPDGEAKKK